MMDFKDALAIAYPMRSDKAATINAGRSIFIKHRAAEMLADPKEIAKIARYIVTAHPARLGHVIDDLMRERTGAVAGLLDMMEKAAEDVAQEEWITPVREQA